MLLNWVKSHKYLLSMLTAAAILAYGIAVIPYDEHWYHYAGEGIFGSILFGILTFIREKQQVAGSLGVVAVGSVSPVYSCP
jgi:hypothetical protein